MAQIIKPLSIVLDTSVLNCVANDFYSATTDKRKKAKEFISFINSNGYVPIISFEHIEEFLQTPIESDARKSFEIISQFSSVLWIKNKSSNGLMVGSVHDIIGNEIKAYLSGTSQFSEIISISKENSFVFGTGKEFTEMHSMYLPVLRSHSLYSKQRKKEIASVLNIEFLISGETKISDLLKSELNNSEKVKKNTETSKSDFLEQISNKGDRKLKNPQCIALDFHALVSADINQVIDEGEPESAKELFRTLGFTEEDLVECSTVQELGELATFRDQLKTYARVNNLSISGLDRVRRKYPVNHVLSTHST
jgi:hypothetical protein